MKTATQFGRDDAGPTHDRLAALLARIAAGDLDGLASLYDETSPFVYGLLRRRLGDGAAADEALVEVYSRVWHKAASYRPGRTPALAWLVTTALECVAESGRAAAVGVSPPSDFGGDAAGDAEMMPAATRAREAFGRLDTRQREALRLSYFYGHARLEASLGLSASEARTLVCSGLRSYAEMFRRA